MTIPHHAVFGPATVLVLATLGAGASAEQHEHREHGAHEHGHGTLEVVADGHDLAVALRIPAVNVVGFEHEARSEEERRAVSTALATFADGAALLAPTAAAGCALEAHEVAIGDHELEGHAEHHDAEHERHEEKGHDDHEDHDEHAHEGDGESHSELHAEYRFHCEDPGALDRLEVRFFEHLRDVEELDAAIVTESMQGAAELTADANVLTLSR